MNMEQQQQQHSTTEVYTGGTVVGSAGITAQTSATTYVTIGILQPPPPPSLTTMSVAASTAAPLLTTSTFKTPLLPMPTLEDIEGGVLTTSIVPQSPPPPPLNMQQMHAPIPGGILKYPTNNTVPLNMIIDMGPGPPSMATATTTEYHTEYQTDYQPMRPPPATLALHCNDTTTATAASCSVDTLQSNTNLLLSSTPPSMLTSAATAGTGVTTMPTTLMDPSNIAAGSNNQMITTATPTTTTTATNINNKTSNLRTSAGTIGSSNHNIRQKSTTTKCCACFGSSSSSSRERHRDMQSATSTTKGKKRSKQKTPSLWSALLTNLGICALLLAYTLLGSFIFLTIESEDSSLLHQQRTLASTKRVGVSGRSLSSSTSGSSSGNIYHTQQQQQQQHRLDNGTIVAAAASSTAYDNMGMVSFNNDGYIYGDDAAPQLAIAADTYDVRQRTIENIWDITVSLNILYKENWTKLAALEIAKFQDQLVKRLNEDALLQLSHDLDTNNNGNSPATEAVLLHSHQFSHHYHHGPYEWNFAKAFLYSLTVLTTIGYGNIAPRTTLGRLVTLIYAIFGIPLTLVYLSSTGGILAKVAREVFSKALCCCLCSNCGYCCYDEKRMAEKERRTKRKRQQEELRKQQAAMQEPYYVRSGSMHDSFQTPEKQTPSTTTSGPNPCDMDSLSASESRGSMHGLSILAPILLCLSMMIIYIVFGAIVLYRLENWPLIDGVYFCFMSLSTIGFGDMLPGLRRESTTTTWFCSIYIMSGMALTAMCFNVIHEEIVHRIRIVVEFKKGGSSVAGGSTLDTTNDDTGYYMPP